MSEHTLQKCPRCPDQVIRATVEARGPIYLETNVGRIWIVVGWNAQGPIMRSTDGYKQHICATEKP